MIVVFWACSLVNSAVDTAECSMYAAICLPPEELVEGGQIKVTATYMGYPVFSQTIGICSLLLRANMKCPLQGSVCVCVCVHMYCGMLMSSVNVLC